MSGELTSILKEYSGEKGALIPILQKAQNKLGYLPPEAITEISKFTKIPESEIYGVASFYAQFYFTRRGKYSVKVCLGTACHVRGGQRILDEVIDELGISPGQTTEDYKFSLDRVACFGCCALAPVMTIDSKIFTEMTRSKAIETLKRYKTEQ